MSTLLSVVPLPSKPGTMLRLARARERAHAVVNQASFLNSHVVIRAGRGDGGWVERREGYVRLMTHAFIHARDFCRNRGNASAASPSNAVASLNFALNVGVVNSKEIQVRAIL